jgi:transposase
MKQSAQCFPEVRVRAVRMVLDDQNDDGSQREAIVAISAKIGCAAESLRRRVRTVQRGQGMRPGSTTSELERENRALAARRVFRPVACPAQSHEMLCDAHTLAFAAFGAIPGPWVPSRDARSVSVGQAGAQRILCKHCDSFPSPTTTASEIEVRGILRTSTGQAGVDAARRDH